ncbi:MAG: arsenate reductase ArsC [Betaproteobacteria bacterium]|nr:arsenate reductase ArsC [Betaproteobacteria bacterium]
MNNAPYNVLFLCTGNSARSILAESILNHVGKGRFRAYSAGSHPAGRVNPLALEWLNQQMFPVDELRSKSWDEFAAPGAPRMDFVFTVCDKAAGEVCPVWPGQPMTAHWGIPDPAAVHGTEREARQAMADAFRQLSRRISLFVSLPFDKLDAMAIKREIRAIGSLDDVNASAPTTQPLS